MSYLTTPDKTTRFIEYTLSANQTVSNGDYVKFDTKKTTGGDSVSINSSTGEITLSSEKTYWLTVNTHFKRYQNNTSFTLAFYDSSNNQITEENGGYECDYTIGTTSNRYSANFTAQLLLENPTDTYYLTVVRCWPNSEVHTRTTLFICEIS